MQPRARFSIWYYLGVLTVFLILQATVFSGTGAKEIAYSKFLTQIEEGKVEAVAIAEGKIYGKLKAPGATPAVNDDTIEPPAKETPWRMPWGKEARAERERHFFTVAVADRELVNRLHGAKIEFRGMVESKFFSNLLLNWILPFGALFLFWGFMMRRMGRGPSALSLGKSKAKIYEESEHTKVRFSDVAGVDEAIEEIQEVVQFLKTPEKFKELGASLPRGVLLVGPPGTGKTLLAKAVAGEAGVPFFRMSGSDFVEMFVGVGASRVRDLFEEAKKAAPCIIFIDELDAIGRSRAQGIGAMSNSEQENTLNQLLVEMDGFDAATSVVLLGATNRPEVLDKALLRPGRFDRQVLVDRPHKDGRLAILKVHVKKLKLGDDVELETIAAQTPGFVGADLANLCNEAALFASRRAAKVVELRDFQNAIERVIGGAEKKGKVLNPEDRRRVAIHESGHALISHNTPGADPVQKVSIVPRGQAALGYTLQAPTDDHYLILRHELLGRVRVLLGGRAAEQLVLGNISTGAADDLEKANKLLREFLMVYGMGETLQNLSLVDRSGPNFLGQSNSIASHSPELARAIETEHFRLLKEAYEDDLHVLAEKRELLDALTCRLLETEKLDAADIREILGERVVESARYLDCPPLSAKAKLPPPRTKS